MNRENFYASRQPAGFPGIDEDAPYNPDSSQRHVDNFAAHHSESPSSIPSEYDHPGTNQRNTANPGVLIAVMGATGTGKTTLINLLSGSQLKVGDTLKSCTADVQRSDTFTLDDVPVTLLDTPGFDDTIQSDVDVLNTIASYLTEIYKNKRKLSGIIYLHRITDERVGGVSAKNFRMFRRLCGDQSLKNVIIVTNRWSQVALERGEARERQLMSDDLFFKPALEKGAQMMRHNGSLWDAQDILRQVINNHPEVLNIQREIVDEGKDITETAACGELDKALADMKKHYERQLENLKAEFQQVLAERDLQAQQEIRTLRSQYQTLIDEQEKLRYDLRRKFSEERKKAADEMENIWGFPRPPSSMDHTYLDVKNELLKKRLLQQQLENHQLHMSLRKIDGGGGVKNWFRKTLRKIGN